MCKFLDVVGVCSLMLEHKHGMDSFYSFSSLELFLALLVFTPYTIERSVLEVCLHC